jgi:glutathione S-transferase
LLFDYYGFPPHTYELKWPAPGAPELAARVQGLLGAAGIVAHTDAARGLDHGVFVPLLVSYPKAEIPTVQLSLRAGLSPSEHAAIGRALAPLRDEGVFIIGTRALGELRRQAHERRHGRAGHARPRARRLDARSVGPPVPPARGAPLAADGHGRRGGRRSGARGVSGSSHGRRRVGGSIRLGKDAVMMKLYYWPGACSLSPHIVLREAGLPFTLERVIRKSRQLADGSDYMAVNPKGYVPALALDDGQVLTEGAAIVQYLADLAPASQLAPVAGTMARYRLQEWLSYIAAEIHKGFSTMFHRGAPDEWKRVVKELLATRLALVAQPLQKTPYLMGDTFTVADAYLFTTLTWARLIDLDLSAWPSLVQFKERVARAPRGARGLGGRRLVERREQETGDG